METKHIITLGNAASGKSNYMSASMLYIMRHWDTKYSFNCENDEAIDTINLTEETLKKGIWMDKTQQVNRLEFSVKVPSLIPFITIEKKLIIEDWMGEAFDALGNLNDWGEDSGNNQEIALNPELKKPFLDSIEQANCYVIFIDAQKLLNGSQFDNVLNSLKGLQAQIKKQKNFKSKEVAFVITKSDVLLGTEFTKESENNKLLLDLEKLQNKLRSKYEVFISFLRYHGIKHKIFAVTCVPKTEHFRIDVELGTMPTKEWSVEDMESVIIHTENYGWKIVRCFWAKDINQLYDQVAPFRWIFGEFFFNRIY